MVAEAARVKEIEEPVNMRWTGITLAVGATMLIAASAGAQRKGGAENGLIGIKLYDTGARVVSIYGTPDEIQAVGVGSTQGGGGGFGSGSGGGGGFGPGGPRGGGPKGGGGGGGAPQVSTDSANPFAFGDRILQGGPPSYGGPRSGPPGSQSGPGGGSSSFGPSAPGGAAGGSPFGPSGPGGASGGGGMPPRGGGGAAEVAQYTRWVYNRAGSKYAFIIDKFGRVVQIEAIGLQNNRVKTKRGVGFGATFAQLIKAYNTPDGYEISGDNVLVKFLSKDKVAFRLTRLGEKKPQVVTGIVIAAAKG